MHHYCLNKDNLIEYLYIYLGRKTIYYGQEPGAAIFEGDKRGSREKICSGCRMKREREMEKTNKEREIRSNKKIEEEHERRGGGGGGVM